MNKEEIKKVNDELCHKHGIEDPCPSFGVGYSEGDSCCTHCWEDCSNYHDSCKELTTGKKVKTEVKKEVKKVKETVKSKTVKKEEKKMVSKKTNGNGKKKKVGMKVEKKSVKKESSEKKMSVGNYVTSHLNEWEDLSNEQIAEKVRAACSSKTTAVCVAWYKNRAKKKNG